MPQHATRCFVSSVSFVVLSSLGWGQTIQLPTVRTLGIGTTVTVPDRGSALLGGNTRSVVTPNSSSSSLTRGHVTARIIDLDEMDAAVLAEARRRREARGVLEERGVEKSRVRMGDASLAQARQLSRYVGRSGHVRSAQIVGRQRPLPVTANRPKNSPRDSKNSALSIRRATTQAQSGHSYADLMRLGNEAMSNGDYRVAKRYFLAAAQE